MTILRLVSMICNPSLVYHICVHVRKVLTFLDSIHPSIHHRERERNVSILIFFFRWLVGCVSSRWRLHHAPLPEVDSEDLEDLEEEEEDVRPEFCSS